MAKVKKIEKCSFCAKNEHEVYKLIRGPDACICDECTELCIDIVYKDVPDMAFQMRLLRGQVSIDEFGINPVFTKRKFEAKRNQCFIVCQFSEPFNTIYIDHIKNVTDNYDISSVRADDIYGVSPIIEDIWKGINESSFLIAEITGRNPNVMYEVGIAHTIGKPVILLTQNIDDIPFDLKHYRFILYEYSPRGCRDLEENLHKTIDALEYIWKDNNDFIPPSRLSEIIDL